jgi:acyl-CoA thioesterase-1
MTASSISCRIVSGAAPFGTTFDSPVACTMGRASTLILKLLIFLVCAAFSAGATAAGTILIYGDSLSAAYGIREQDGWVSLLRERLKERGLDYIVVNASVSGETSSGGAARIDAVLERNKPDVVVLELGANDGLRGLPISAMKENLARIIRAAQNRKARVLLVGMRIPPNYGSNYTSAFFQAFGELAREHKTAYIPFLFEGLDDRPELFLPDQVHPTGEAQRALLETVWKGLEPLLKR